MSAEDGLLGLADATAEDIQANAATLRARASTAVTPPRVVIWFLPIVTHALKGGVRTIFMMASRFSEQWGTLNQFVLYSYSGGEVSTAALAQSLRMHFPKLRFVVSAYRRGVDTIDTLPESDVAFCTLWTTAYLLLKYNKTARKFYFMQDFEPLFYPAGAVYGAIEQTYRFGFACIANTPGVAERYRQYSDDVVHFLPGVDRTVFHPLPTVSAPQAPYRVVFYGRPSNARNCFALGAEIARLLKREFGERIDIVSVGEKWSEKEHRLENVVRNLGLLDSLEAVADLYRRSHVGMVFMMTPHPSYQPLEYMACGCAVATNINPANRWLLDDDNALILAPVPAIAAQKISALLQNPDQWQLQRRQGLKAVEALSWETAFATVEKRIYPG